MKVKNIKELMKGLNNRIKKLEAEQSTTLEDFKYCLDRLLTIAEEHYPNYFNSDNIASINDIYKKYFDTRDRLYKIRS